MDTMLATIGIVVKEPWAVDISYEMLNYTLYRVEDGGDGCGYIALKDNIGVTPGSDETVWRKAVQAGQSIYDLAVKYHHFVGTEEEFEAQYQAALQAAIDAAAGASAVEAQVEAAEAMRVQAESSRESAETARAAAESARATAEASREAAESSRASAESSRASAESSRATAETARQSAETTRQSNEAARESAEGTRTQQFEALKADMQVAIGQADAAATAATEAAASAAQTESDIEAAEASRVIAEQGRVTAEQGRASAEQGRANAESARVTAEAARETQAGADHTRAGSDHTQAGSDHTQAVSDHTRAESDHTRAESDHTAAAADHTQAGSDHAVVEGYNTRLTNVEDEVSQLGQEVTDLKKDVDGNEFALFNEGKLVPKIVSNSYVDQNTGAFIAYNNWSRTDYINVRPFSKIKISASHESYYGATYDANKQRIARLSVVNGSVELAITDDIHYIAISDANAYVSSFAFEILGYKVDDVADGLDTFKKDTTNKFGNYLGLPAVEDAAGWIAENTFHIGGGTHKALFIGDGKTSLKVTANEQNSCYFFIAKSYTPPTENVAPDFATGETARRWIDVGDTETITLPGDARYIIVGSEREGANFIPAELIIDGCDYVSDVKKIQPQINNLTERVVVLENAVGGSVKIFNPYDGMNFDKRVLANSHEHCQNQEGLQNIYGRGVRIVACSHYMPAVPRLPYSNIDWDYEDWESVGSSVVVTRNFQGSIPTISVDGETIDTDTIPQIANAEHPFIQEVSGHFNILGLMFGDAGYNLTAADGIKRAKSFMSLARFNEFLSDENKWQFGSNLAFGTINHNNHLPSCELVLDTCPNVFKAMELFNQGYGKHWNQTFKDTYDALLSEGYRIWGTAVVDWQGDWATWGYCDSVDKAEWEAKYDALPPEEKSQYANAEEYYTAVGRYKYDRGVNVLMMPFGYEQMTPQEIAREGIKAFNAGRYYMAGTGNHWMQLGVSSGVITFRVSDFAPTLKIVTANGTTIMTNKDTIQYAPNKNDKYVRFEAEWDDGDFVYSNPCWVE